MRMLTFSFSVYSQFITLIEIISKVCEIEGWNSCQFTGKTSADKRAKIVKEFETNPSINIMVTSFKCGGTGLNLTCASRVLLVDLWWNSALEDQGKSLLSTPRRWN